MDNFSEFIKAVRLSCHEESPIRKFADAVSKADTLQKVIYLNSECSRLQSECNLLIQINQLNPAIDVSEALENRLDLLNQNRSLLNQMGNDVVADEAQITAVDIERKKLEYFRGKQNTSGTGVLYTFGDIFRRTFGRPSGIR